MTTVNEHYRKLQGSYLFSSIGQKVRAYQEQHPDARIISLGIGDVTQPLIPAVISALHLAVEEMGQPETFRGYAPDLGYDFLRNAIAEEYRSRGCDIAEDEVFVSDGAKSDSGNIQEIFGPDCRVAVCDPVYPVYVDSNVMAGRSGEWDAEKGRYSNFLYMPCTEENGFMPELPTAGYGPGRDERSAPELIYLCSPNNPTGNSFKERDIRTLLDSFKGILVLDEAYIDYSEEGSKVSLLDEYPNLIILQTLSKAYGLAGLRVGMALADPDIVRMFDKVRYPYNIGTDTMRLALGRISPGKVSDDILVTLRQRASLSDRLASFKCVEKVYPSDANFLLVKVSDPGALHSHLLSDGIIVRNRSSVRGCEGCLRLTVGTPEENERIIRSISRFENPSIGVDPDAPVGGRRAVKDRVTRETRVFVETDLDGKGVTSISTGLRFFDHMLEQIPHHSGISLRIIAEGDLDVDEHHTMEDVAITLGETILEALGDRRGIGRYGFALPMDECDAFVSMDLGGRIDFKWDVVFTREYVGDTPTEMFKHFFQSLCSALRCNLHISAKGENNHHLAESVFKAFARTLGQAVRRDPSGNSVPSSKGVL